MLPYSKKKLYVGSQVTYFTFAVTNLYSDLILFVKHFFIFLKCHKLLLIVFVLLLVISSTLRQLSPITGSAEDRYQCICQSVLENREEQRVTKMKQK